MKQMHWMTCCVLVLAFTSVVFAAPPAQLEIKPDLAKSLAPMDIDYQTYIDANRLLMFVTNVGSFAYDNHAIFGKADGLYYPKGGDKAVIYSAGLWLGGKVDNDLRVSLAEYSHTYWPGPMVSGTYIPGADGDHQYRVYKILRQLYESGFYDEDEPAGPDSLVQLWRDYHEWPVDLGAPAETVSVGAARGPDSTLWIRPKFLGDQTLWSVYNDANPDVHDNWIGTTEGLGVEVQETDIAIDHAGMFGDCIFMRYLIINKSTHDVEDMYVSFWADPDLGHAADDFAGCDSTLNLGYCYNATNGDNIYGSSPPAVGFMVLQGPMTPSPGDSARFLGGWRHGYRNLPMTAYERFIIGSDPENAQETYWCMQGLDAQNAANPIVDPTNGHVTTYMFSGDPVMGTGWVDCCTVESFKTSIIPDIFEVAGPGGVPLDPPVDVACSYNSTGEFFITSDQECNFNRMNWQHRLGNESWEFRFTTAGSEYYDFTTDEKFGNRAPFEVWNIGWETPDDPSDDKRIQFFILDDDESGDLTPGDRTYPFEREYPAEPLPQLAEYTWDDDFHIGRIVFQENVPQEGTVVRFIGGEPDTVYDTVAYDVRYLVSCGPFDMAESDTQEVVMAVLIGAGFDRLNSVTELKNLAMYIPWYLTEDWEYCDCMKMGDLNSNGIAWEIADLIHMINYAFRGGPEPPSDPDCPLINRADFNCDDRINLLDIVMTARYIYTYPSVPPCDPCNRWGWW